LHHFLEKAKDLYEKGAKAGEKALGPEIFEKECGYFWGIVETRPYMRARAGLAECLWFLGEYEKAIKHFTEMLHLNPNDNQGIRYLLINCLLEKGYNKDAKKLLHQFEGDISTTWLYSRALLIFRKERVNSKANKLLRKALNYNSFVPLYILSRRKLPSLLPEYVSPGDENEAIAYVFKAYTVWLNTPGAIDWLASNLPNNVK